MSNIINRSPSLTDLSTYAIKLPNSHAIISSCYSLLSSFYLILHHSLTFRRPQTGYTSKARCNKIVLGQRTSYSFSLCVILTSHLQFLITNSESITTMEKHNGNEWKQRNQCAKQKCTHRKMRQARLSESPENEISNTS